MVVIAKCFLKVVSLYSVIHNYVVMLNSIYIKVTAIIIIIIANGDKLGLVLAYYVYSACML